MGVKEKRGKIKRESQLLRERIMRCHLHLFICLILVNLTNFRKNYCGIVREGKAF